MHALIAARFAWFKLYSQDRLYSPLPPNSWRQRLKAFPTSWTTTTRAWLPVQPTAWKRRPSSASYDLLNIYNLIDTDMIMPVKLLQASGLHVTYWRHSGESGGPIYHQYPPFFYSELRNFAVLFSPRKSALGFRSPDPEDVKGKLSRRWGINIRLQQAKPGRGGSLFIQQRKVCWRLRDDTMF